MIEENENNTNQKSQNLAAEIAVHLKDAMPSFRDKDDIAEIKKQRRLIYFFGISTIILSIIAFVLFIRKPDLITAQTTPDGRRVVSINNRDFGCTEAVELGKDNLTNDDKTYLANQFANWIYGVNLASRDKDIERALRLIEDKKFLKSYADQLAGGQLQAEKSEQWSAVWSAQKITVDENDPMIVRIIGTQEITYVVNNLTKHSTVQHQLEFRLTTAGSRLDDNLRTGFRILAFSGEELSRKDS